VRECAGRAPACARGSAAPSEVVRRRSALLRESADEVLLLLGAAPRRTKRQQQQQQQRAFVAPDRPQSAAARRGHAERLEARELRPAAVRERCYLPARVSSDENSSTSSAGVPRARLAARGKRCGRRCREFVVETRQIPHCSERRALLAAARRGRAGRRGPSAAARAIGDRALRGARHLPLGRDDGFVNSSR